MDATGCFKGLAQFDWLRLTMQQAWCISSSPPPRGLASLISVAIFGALPCAARHSLFAMGITDPHLQVASDVATTGGGT
jgi:hypothetical protein